MIAKARRLLLALAVLTPALLFVPAPAHAASHAITMASYAFSPASATITVGDTVTWTNTDQAPHDVTTTSAPVSIHSSELSTGQSWSYTFTVPGTYSYICSIHPDMKATLVVKPAEVAPSTQAAPPPVTAHRSSITTERVVPQTIPGTSAAAPPPVTMAAPTTMDMGSGNAAQPAAAGPTSNSSNPGLNPLLLVAGLVAAVATLCLLLIGSKPEPGKGGRGS
jgi:plastocyanin